MDRTIADMLMELSTLDKVIMAHEKHIQNMLEQEKRYTQNDIKTVKEFLNIYKLQYEELGKEYNEAFNSSLKINS